MRAVLSLPIVLLLVTAAGAEDKWETYSSDDYHFSVQFPAKPVEKQDTKSFQVLLEAREGAAVYLVGVAHLESDLDDDETVERQFKAGRESTLNALKGGKLISERKTKFARTFPARDLEVEVPEVGIYRVRILLTGTELYQIVTMGPKDFVDHADAKKFLASFALRE